MFNNELWQKPTAAGATGIYPYQIANSLRLNGTSQALERSFSSTPSNADAKALSFWIKRSGASGTNSAFGSTTNTKIVSASTGNGATGMSLEINTNNPTGYSDQFHYYLASGGSNFLKAKWRDPSAWIHIVWIYNSDESTTTDRIKVYINGESNTINDSNYWDNDGNNGYPSSGADTSFGLNGNEMHIGRYVYDDAGWWGGQMADFIMIDGTASISDFGETHNGVWRPKDPSGLTFGNNGFWLKFTNTSSPGEDFSGNDNDFTTIGTIPADDFLLDTPTFNSSSNGGNFCTINPVFRGTETSDAKYGTVTEGNLKLSYTSTSDVYQCCTHKVPASGKWYWEYAIIAGGGNSNFNPGFGIFDPNGEAYASGDGGNKGFVDSIVYNNGDNNVYKARSSTKAYDGSRGSNGDVMGVALDMDNGAIYFSKNGTWYSSGGPESGASRTNAGATWTPASEFTAGAVPLACCGGGSSPQIVANFGQEGTFGGTETAGGNSDTNGYGNFYSAVPSGYSAVCTGALSVAEEIDPAKTDDNYPQKLFGAKTYTGSGGTQTISGVGFQPDFTWLKNRGAGSTDNVLMDSTRGEAATNDYYYLRANTTAAQDNTTDFHNFASDGFILGGTGTYFNASGNTFASWNWRANGGTTSSNATGDITSTVQADPSGGFSIFTYTGSGTSGNTVAHGLSQAPTMTIIKQINSTNGWNVWATGYNSGDYDSFGELNSTGAWNANQGSNGPFTAAPGATLLTLTAYGQVNGSSNTYVGYAFSDIEGYIKVGSYEGNGNANGSFVYTGFRPALIIYKNVEASQSWVLIDNARNTYNVSAKALGAEGTWAESDSTVTYGLDILSNGFKMRGTNNVSNGSYTYLYLAFAKNPFKYATAV